MQIIPFDQEFNSVIEREAEHLEAWKCEVKLFEARTSLRRDCDGLELTQYELLAIGWNYNGLSSQFCYVIELISYSETWSDEW